MFNDLKFKVYVYILFKFYGYYLKFDILNKLFMFGEFLNFIKKNKIEILVIFRLYSIFLKIFYLVKYFDSSK